MVGRRILDQRFFHSPHIVDPETHAWRPGRRPEPVQFAGRSVLGSRPARTQPWSPLPPQRGLTVHPSFGGGTGCGSLFSQFGCVEDPLESVAHIGGHAFDSGYIDGPFEVAGELCSVLTPFLTTYDSVAVRLRYPTGLFPGVAFPLVMYMLGQGAMADDQAFMELVASLGYVTATVNVVGLTTEAAGEAYAGIHEAVRAALACRLQDPTDDFNIALWPQSVFVGHSRGGGGAIVGAEIVNGESDSTVEAVVSLAPADVSGNVGGADLLAVFGTHDIDSDVEQVLESLASVTAASTTFVGLRGVGHGALGPSPNSAGGFAAGEFWFATDIPAWEGRPTRDFIVAEFLKKTRGLPNLLDRYIWENRDVFGYLPSEHGIGTTTLIGSFFHRNRELPAVEFESAGIVPDRRGVFFAAGEQAVASEGVGVNHAVTVSGDLLDVLESRAPVLISGCYGDPDTNLRPKGFLEENVVMLSWDMFQVSGEELETLGEGRLALELAHGLDYLASQADAVQEAMLLLELALVVRSELNERSRELHGLNQWRPRVGLGSATGPQVLRPTAPVEDAFGLWCPMYAVVSGDDYDSRITALQTVRIPLREILPEGPGGVSHLFFYPFCPHHPAGEAVLARVSITRPPSDA